MAEPRPLGANLGFAFSVAELGLLLRQSTHRGAASIDRLIERARRFRGADPHKDRGEFIALARRAGTLIDQLKAGQPSQ